MGTYITDARYLTLYFGGPEVIITNKARKNIRTIFVFILFRRTAHCTVPAMV